MFTTIVQKTHRVPRSFGAAGDGSAVARQLDAVLLSVGFSASANLLSHVAELNPGDAMDLAVSTVVAVRQLVGDHVQHNSYFIRFPEGVPDTMGFWVESMRAALVPVGSPLLENAELDEALRQIVTGTSFDLLSLPRYGRYQHSFADLLAVHDELIESRKDRITLLQLGGTFEQETRALYFQLAGSTTPLGESDLELLGLLSADCLDGPQPETIPVRENRAVINMVRLDQGAPLVAVDTVTDVLRLAAALSHGDVSLVEPTRFINFKRRERRALLSALHNVVNDNKLCDVRRYAEPWKRLSKALHPADYPQYSGATAVFGVARGDLRFPSIASRAEDAFRAEDYVRAARVLSAAPGAFLRALDRMLRGATGAQQEEIVTLATVAMKSASGRVLLSLREHLMNRFTPDAARVFVGRTKRAWVTPDERAPLQMGPVSRLADAIDGELIDRMPVSSHLVVDPAVLDMALPLSGKASAAGFEVLPRGSRSHIVAEPGDSLRFFTYWREEARRTDYDLSLLMLGEDFSHAGFVSWTNYSDEGVFYSGDIVASPNGATEFIDVRLDMVRPEVHYLVPQVNIYCGESFEEVAESMFGWMLRNEEQRGMPFEARTVRTRSEMRGTGQVALPIVFARNDDGTWSAVWTHLYLQGQTGFNRVEGNRLSTGLLAQGIVGRRYLNMEYLLALRSRVAAKAELWTPGMKLDGPVTFVGREAPEGLPEGSEVFAGDRLTELIPG